MCAKFKQKILNFMGNWNNLTYWKLRSRLIFLRVDYLFHFASIFFFWHRKLPLLDSPSLSTCASMSTKKSSIPILQSTCFYKNLLEQEEISMRYGKCWIGEKLFFQNSVVAAGEGRGEGHWRGRGIDGGGGRPRIRWH